MAPKLARAKRECPEILSRTEMQGMVVRYAEAKSRADVGAALALCHEDFEVSTVSFGVGARGRTAGALYFQAFFRAFPDYRVSLDGLAYGDDTVACWGDGVHVDARRISRQPTDTPIGPASLLLRAHVQGGLDRK